MTEEESQFLLAGDDRFGLHASDFLAQHLVINQILDSKSLTDGLILQKTPFAAIEAETYQVNNTGDKDAMIQLMTEPYRDPTGLIDPPTTPVSIVLEDTKALNGIIHEIDGLLIPKFAYLDVGGGLRRYETKYKTFIQMLVSANFEGSVEAASVGTVLAPTEDAWALTEVDTVDFLLRPENMGILLAVLKNHLSTEVFNYDLRLFAFSTMLNPDQPVTIQYQTNNMPIFGGIPATSVSLYRSGVIYEMTRVNIPN